MDEKGHVHFVEGPLHGMDRYCRLDHHLRVAVMDESPLIVTDEASGVPESTTLKTGLYRLEQWRVPYDARPRWLYLYQGER